MLAKVAFGKNKSAPVIKTGQSFRSQSQVSQLTLSRDLSQSSSLADALQTTLDSNQLLSIYAEFIRSRVTIDALQFVSDDQIFNLFGEYHDNDYQHVVMLYADKTFLGQLVYSLKRPLTLPQKVRLEQFHRELTFPLRNAMDFSRLHRQAVRDHLTGLGNRALLDEILTHLHIKQRRDQERSHCVMMLDLDGFKDVNDEYGHQQGDDILRTFADLIKQAVRDSDQVFRFGGDEFVIVMEDTDLYQAQTVYQRLRLALAACSELQMYNLTISAGTARLNSLMPVEQIMQEADQRLYQAKQSGKNQHCGSIGCA
ncbi:MAG: GGDEF domain-containing protein [Pseudomonadota bacterium]